MSKIVRIFIVEDEEVFSRLLSHRIQDLQAEYEKKGLELKYLTFYSGEEATYELRQDPDIILLDYYLYNDGLDAEDGLKALKDIKRYNSGIEVVVISGQKDQEVADSLISNGAYQYIPKDETAIEAVTLTIRELLDRKVEA